MIIHEKNEKTLVIPSALGNFGNGGGTGGGVTSGQVVEIVESAITEYDNTIEPKIEALSGATSALSEDITLLETTVGNHTTDIEALSGATSGISKNLTELSGATTGISEDLAELSGATTGISENLSNLSAATEHIADSLTAYTPTQNFATINGSGITNGGNLVIESGSNVRTYILNRMSQQELKDLYDELAPYGTPNTGVNSAFTPSEWAFFLQYQDNEWDFGGDGFRGILPLTIASIHPGDYGGAIFFTGVAGSRSNRNSVLKVRYIVTSDGSIDKNAGWIELPTASPWGFSWPDNGKLCYDADNSKFVMVNWYDPSSDQRDVDTTGNTFGISAAAAVDRFLNEGNWYADDRNGYAQPRFEMTILSGGSVYSYVFPSIFGETITSTTIDGQTYTRRYSFTYTREDGSAFVVNMLLNNDQYGAQIEYENVESGGGDGLVHLQTLSGATGETNVVYECDGELFWWNENSGYTGFWSEDMAPFTANSTDYGFGLSFSIIPEGTTVISGVSYSSGEKWNVIYRGGNVVVETVEGTEKKVLNVGETWSGRPGSFTVYLLYEAHYIGFAVYGNFKLASVWDGQANGAHWELVEKEVYPYIPKGTFDSGIMVPNKKGHIYHKAGNLSKKNLNLNGSTMGYFYTDGNTSTQAFYAPTVSGTAGQMLQSNGNNAPIWTTLIKSVKITSDEYDALVQAGTTDPNTLYLIDDE